MAYLTPLRKMRKQRHAEEASEQAKKDAVEKEFEDTHEQRKNEKIQASQDARQKAQEQGRVRGEELFNRYKNEGLESERHKAMQYEANKQVQRGEQNASRRLLGGQSQRGISGKGGVAFAQQRELKRLSDDAKGQARRDLDKLNEDMALKKAASVFAVEQGEASQDQLDRQIAEDELNYQNERKRQRSYEDQFNRNFSRI